jgi:hypothetical protein
MNKYKKLEERDVVCMRQMRSTHEILDRKSEVKHTLGRPRCKQGDNIKKKYLN